MIKFHIHFKETVVQRCSVENVFLEILQNSQENTSVKSLFLLELPALACNFIQKMALAHVFSCEFCEIFKNTFPYRTPPMAASYFTIRPKNK